MSEWNVYRKVYASEEEVRQSRFEFIVKHGVPGMYIEAAMDFLEGLEQIRKPEADDLKGFVLRQMRGHRKVKKLKKVDSLEWFHNMFGKPRKVVIRIRRRSV